MWSPKGTTLSVIRCPTLQVSQFLFPGQRSDTFLTEHVGVQQLVLQIYSPHVMIIISHAQRLLCFMPLLEALCVSALWYVDTVVKFLLSRHFSTVTGLECLAMISALSSFLFFTTLARRFKYFLLTLCVLSITVLKLLTFTLK